MHQKIDETTSETNQFTDFDEIYMPIPLEDHLLEGLSRDDESFLLNINSDRYSTTNINKDLEAPPPSSAPIQEFCSSEQCSLDAYVQYQLDLWEEENFAQKLKPITTINPQPQVFSLPPPTRSVAEVLQPQRYTKPKRPVKPCNLKPKDILDYLEKTILEPKDPYISITVEEISNHYAYYYITQPGEKLRGVPRQNTIYALSYVGTICVESGLPIKRSNHFAADHASYTYLDTGLKVQPNTRLRLYDKLNKPCGKYKLFLTEDLTKIALIRSHYLAWQKTAPANAEIKIRLASLKADYLEKTAIPKTAPTFFRPENIQKEIPPRGFENAALALEQMGSNQNLSLFAAKRKQYEEAVIEQQVSKRIKRSN